MAKDPRQPATSAQPAGKTAALAITKKDFDGLASFLESRERSQAFKKDRNGEAVRSTGELFENREYVAAYECFKPVYDKVVTDMQRVLARNLEFEANKLAKALNKSVAVAKENVLSMRAHAKQIVDQFDKLLTELKNKPLVRLHLKKAPGAATAAPVEEAPPTVLSSASETRVDAKSPAPSQNMVGNTAYEKRPYVPPEIGNVYSVRDKLGSDRIIRVTGLSDDGTQVEVQTHKDGQPSKAPVLIAIESLARQAAKGWCNLLVRIGGDEPQSSVAATRQVSDTGAEQAGGAMMRLDSQNFGRVCGDIARAKINFSTQLIKDVGDGPFRAGDFEQAFLTFEQLSIGFNSAVAASRRTIADGRRVLNAEKGNLSGKEIQERTAAFVRHEQLIHTAEREFSTILEGLRMYLRASQG
jgi:hypothetical protein